MSEREIPPSHDPLGEVLQLLKLSGTLYCRSHLTAPWSVASKLAGREGGNPGV